MTFLTHRQIKTTLAPAILASFLAACGGGGSSETSTETASLATSSKLYSKGSTVSLFGEVQPKTASPNGDSFLYHETISSFESTPSTSEGPAGQDANAFALTFHDSFDGELDANVWNIDRTRNAGREDTSNSTTNYATRDGALKIWPERGRNGEFFDRTLDTNGRFSQQYGYFEIEAKLPKGKGVWPAFWLLNMDGSRRPEIDIMEAYPGGQDPWGAPDANGVPSAKMYAPVVWTDAGDRAGFAMVPTPDLSESFHRYGTKWEPNKVTFYFDGREVHSIDVAVSDPLYMIVNLWYGSASGYPDDTTPTGESNSYEVNYVKAWQFK